VPTGEWVNRFRSGKTVENLNPWYIDSAKTGVDTEVNDLFFYFPPA